MWENLLVVTGSNPLSVLMIFLPNLLLILLFPSTYFCVMRIRNLYKHNYSKLLQISNNRKQKNTCAAGNTDVADVYIKMLLAVWYLALRNVGSRHRIVERQDLRKNVCLLTCLFVPLKMIMEQLHANCLPTTYQRLFPRRTYGLTRSLLKTTQLTLLSIVISCTGTLPG